MKKSTETQYLISAVKYLKDVCQLKIIGYQEYLNLQKWRKKIVLKLILSIRCMHGHILHALKNSPQFGNIPFSLSPRIYQMK